MGSLKTEDDAPRRRVAARGARAWADVSLRTKLLLFALGLVTVPGAIFAIVAFAGTRAALEREIGIRLRQSAERGAEAVTAAVRRAEHDARSLAQQDLMRDLMIGDVDKRVSQLLRGARGAGSPYAAILALDEGGVVVAASSGDWIGQHPPPAVGGTEAAVSGPISLSAPARRVLVVTTSIASPDPPQARVGTLVLLYDWDDLRRLLDAIRLRLNGDDTRVATFVVDAAGTVIGGTAFDGSTAVASTLRVEMGQALASDGYGTGTILRGNADRQPVLVGVAPIDLPALGWRVLVAERTREAFAVVDRVRRRWIAMLAGLLLVGLTAAALLARQVLRPLSEVTGAIGDLAANPDRSAPPLPVRSRNEVGRLAESFNRMTTALRRSRAEATSAAKFAFAGQLAAMVAHEVRTPLAVMRSSAQLLGNRALPSAQQSELVETIVAEVDRIERVVTELIQVARPVEPRFEATPLDELLTRAAGFVAAQASRQHIELVRDITAQPPARGDRDQLYQVLLNLIINALQALPPGGRLTLRSLAPHGGCVGFEVADDGPGLPAGIRDRVFEPFVSGRDDGTGLGLAFVERVVLAHQGTVTVHSQPGRGTVFAVRVPMAGAGA